MAKASELSAILEAGDVQNVMAFFQDMPEKERRSHASQCLTWHKEIRKNDFIETAPGTFSGNPLSPAANVALFCIGTYSELTKAPLWSLPRGDVAFEILADRHPQWVEQWATYLLDGERYWQDWRLVRRMVREGLIEKPDHPNYALGMISGINIWGGKPATVKERLDEDPELLDDEVWRLFEYEGGGENSLANCDRFGGNGWADSFLAYIEEGKLSRERLLACSIEALRRDFNHYRAKWFATFYDVLKPTKEEDCANAATFLSLLGVSAPNIVSWAFKKVQVQAKTRVYSAEELVSGLRPALEARGKGMVKSALKLLDRTAKDAPDVRPDAVTTAVVALGHEATDVQAAALDLIEQHGADTELADALGDYVEIVAPSLRARLEALVGPSDRSEPDEPEAEPEVGDLAPELRQLFNVDELLAQPGSEVWTLPAATFDGTDLSQLVGRAPIVPMKDLDELIDLAARVLEDAVGPEDVERVLDGFSRLCDQRPDDFDRRTAPLMKRILQLMKRDYTPFAGEGPASDLCGLIHAWVTGATATVRIVKPKERNRHDMVVVTIDGDEHRQYAGNYKKTVGALARRVHALSHRVAARKVGPLLGAPTHTGCLIDPMLLAERVNAWQGDPPATIEVVLALLRLAPERRAQALELLDESDDEWRQAIRHAMGGRATIGKSGAMWGAAARSRSPWGADGAVRKAFPKSGPDIGEPAVYDVSFEPDKYKSVRVVFPAELKERGIDPDCIPVVLHTERGDSMWELGGLGGRSDASIRWTASAWPIARESFFAAALIQIAENLDWWEARWYSKTLMEPLLDPGTPLRQMGLMLLATGLAAKEPGEHGLATDAAIAAIEDGRLGSDNLGHVLAQLLASGLVKPARWAKTLAEVARASDAHAAVVKLSLEQSLGVVADPPRDYAKLLELLKELCVQFNHGVTGANRAHLESVKGSNKVAKMAKALLTVPIDTNSGPMRSAANRLTEMRVAAATRWQPEDPCHE